ncbi:hypothetical protein [Kitasatospora azatica]|nr:hypothetical protein [Kitasatospora azatica]
MADAFPKARQQAFDQRDFTLSADNDRRRGMHDRRLIEPIMIR